MLDPIDQSLRVHDERPITTEGQSIKWLVRGCRRQQGRDSKTHIAGACFSEGASQAVIFNDLEAVSLNIASIEDADHILFPGPVCSQFNGGRLGKYFLTPGFIV